MDSGLLGVVLGILGLAFRVGGSGFRAWFGLGYRIYESSGVYVGFRKQNLGFWLWALGFKASGLMDLPSLVLKLGLLQATR